MGNKFGKIITKHVISLKSLEHKTIVIDGSIYLYKFSCALRQSNGDLFKNKNNRITSHLYGLVKLLCNLLSKNIKIIFVTDGKPHLLKNETIEKRNLLKNTATEHIDYLFTIKSTNLNLLKALKLKSFRITDEMYDSLATLLNILNIPYVKANGEGESQCVWFFKNKIADAILSDDWDLLLYDIPEFYRNISVKTGLCDYINIEENLKVNEINKQQLLSAIILSGTDYNKSINQIGPITALKLIKEYKTIRNIPTIKYNITPLYEKHDIIINYLKNYDLHKYDYTSFNFKKPNLIQLELFLTNFCNFSQDYILNILKLLT